MAPARAALRASAKEHVDEQGARLRRRAREGGEDLRARGGVAPEADAEHRDHRRDDEGEGRGAPRARVRLRASPGAVTGGAAAGCCSARALARTEPRGRGVRRARRREERVVGAPPRRPSRPSAGSQRRQLAQHPGDELSLEHRWGSPAKIAGRSPQDDAASPLPLEQRRRYRVVDFLGVSSKSGVRVRSNLWVGEGHRHPPPRGQARTAPASVRHTGEVGQRRTAAARACWLSAGPRTSYR